MPVLRRAPIKWAVTLGKRRRIPLDPTPTEDGNVVLTEDGKAVVLSPQADSFPLDDGPRYVSHFATCPNAAKHRKGAR